MKTVTITASKSYDVIVAPGIRNQISAYLSAISPKSTAVIVSDSNVWPLYGADMECNLRASGITTIHYVLPAGEASKNANTYLSILNFLAENHITRSDILIALGGGVVGDITGFAAATYLRGIPYVQVPTSLLAMVDSSVGGKTAIDLPSGKNLVGAFYQPSLVLCDTQMLDSLPDEIFRDGCGEVIKYGVLYDRELFMHLLDRGIQFDRETVISRCIELKRNVVADDEFDRGPRQMLNLGHTIGHGIELHSNFMISHGKAVALGMVIVSKAGSRLSICSQEARNSIMEAVKKFGLPTRTSINAHALYEAMLVDKKRSGNTINLIIPEEIGRCAICPTQIDNLKSFIEAGL
ncbi:MAG: 3-dehydroquinate synthase [Oscillospiraceae bacterium]|nr:3-dehydroquinate synthase [Oscillospiraceae bacterium]